MNEFVTTSESRTVTAHGIFNSITFDFQMRGMKTIVQKECIKNDCDNVYLLFMHGPIGLNISPNYYAHLVREDNTIRLEYEFNVGEWF